MDKVNQESSAVQELQRRYDEMAKIVNELHVENTKIVEHRNMVAAQLEKQTECYVIPGGFCEAWSAIVSLVHIAFPVTTVDAIATDLFHHYKSVVGIMYLQDLIKRFSYNLYVQTLDANNLHSRPCCFRDEKDTIPIDVNQRCKK